VYAIVIKDVVHAGKAKGAVSTEGWQRAWRNAQELSDFGAFDPFTGFGASGQQLFELLDQF